MRLLFFIDCLGAGGAQRQLVGLAKMLRSLGNEVKICTYYNGNFFEKDLENSGIIHDVVARSKNSGIRFFELYHYFLTEKPDCVISFLDTPCLIACIIKLLLGIRCRLIVSERNTTQKVRLNEFLRFNLFRIADVIVPNSFSQEKWLLNHYSWMSSKLTTISNFVDLEVFRPVDHNRKSVPEILVAASIWESKNTIGLIHAINILKKERISCHFSWYGKTESNVHYFNKCQELIYELGLEKYIDLLPKTDQIVNKYQESDYFCLPSFYEGTPNVICEAIATGLPIICSDVCDNSRYVKDGINGFLFNPSCSDSIAESIINALSLNNDQYKTFCINSVNIANNMLSKELFLKSYIEVIGYECAK